MSSLMQFRRMAFIIKTRPGYFQREAIPSARSFACPSVPFPPTHTSTRPPLHLPRSRSTHGSNRGRNAGGSEGKNKLYSTKGRCNTTLSENKINMDIVVKGSRGGSDLKGKESEVNIYFIPFRIPENNTKIYVMSRHKDDQNGMMN